MSADKTMIEAVKAHVGEILGKTTADIEAMDGKLEEALHEVKKKTDASADEVKQLTALNARLQKRVDNVEAAQQLHRPSTDEGEFERELKASALYADWKAGKFQRLPGAQGGSAGSSALQLKGSLVFAKKETTIGTTELGAFVDPAYRPGIIERAMATPRVILAVPRKLIKGALLYRARKDTKQSGYGYWHSTLAAAIVADAGSTATFTSVDGLFAGIPAARVFVAGVMHVTPAITAINTTTKVVTFASPLTFDAANGSDVVSEYYGATAESTTKPYGYMAGEVVELPLRTIATLMGTSQQVIDSLPNLAQTAQGRMTRRATKNINWHILYGNGASDVKQLHGFFSNLDSNECLWSEGESKDTMADAVMRGALMIPSDGLIEATLNRDDWGKLLKAKDSTDRYIHGSQGAINIINRPGLRAIGEYVVRIDDALKPADFLVADHLEASELIDQGTEAFALGYINDQFAINEVTMRHEWTGEHFIASEESYTRGQFDSQPA